VSGGGDGLVILWDYMRGQALHTVDLVQLRGTALVQSLYLRPAPRGDFDAKLPSVKYCLSRRRPAKPWMCWPSLPHGVSRWSSWPPSGTKTMQSIVPSRSVSMADGKLGLCFRANYKLQPSVRVPSVDGDGTAAHAAGHPPRRPAAGRGRASHSRDGGDLRPRGPSLGCYRQHRRYRSAGRQSPAMPPLDQRRSRSRRRQRSTRRGGVSTLICIVGEQS